MQDETERKAREIIGEAIGYGSLCWDPKPSGVFDSTAGVRGVELFTPKVLEMLRTAEAAGFARGESIKTTSSALLGWMQSAPSRPSGGG